MRKSLLLAAAVLLWAGPAPSVSANQIIGDVTKVELSAFGTPPADSRRELFLGNAVVENELLETVVGGGASITFPDGSQFHLGSGSQAALDKFVYDPSQGKGVLQLGEGVFRFIGSPGGGKENLEIVTADAVIGIRGTDVVIINAAGRKTAVGLASGSVAVESRLSGKSAVAVPGQIVLIDPNGTDVVVRDAPVRADDLICWLSRDPYICKAGASTASTAAPATGQPADSFSGAGTAAVSPGSPTGGGSTGGGSTGGGSTGGGSTGGGSTGGGSTGGGSTGGDTGGDTGAPSGGDTGDDGGDGDNGHGNDVGGVDPSNPGASDGPPGQTGAEPPGQSDNGPGNSDSAPGHGDDGPGNSGNAPGRS